MWFYSQKTGTLTRNGMRFTGGYSGHDAGKNNPAMQSVHDVGPIPQGEYTIGELHDNPHLGPHVMAVAAKQGTNTFGRDGFYIHGDSVAHPGSASHGCIILGRQVRDLISASKDTDLTVTE